MSTEVTTGLASAGGHWYTQTGEAAYEVEKAKGGMRPATLRDARKLGLFPSVTGIIKEKAAPGLTNWFIDQAIDAAANNPRLSDESEDQWKARVKFEGRVKSELARERGTLIHAAIEMAFEGRSVDKDLAPFAFPVVDWVDKEFPGWTRRAEHSFAHTLGFGGKIDLVLEHDSRFAIIDFKTTDKDVDTVKGWPEHAYQLAACARGVNADFDNTDFINLFVSSTEPGKLKPFYWGIEDIDRGWEVFKALLNVWKHSRGYYPGRME
jgi:hypothetical protein